MTALVPYLDLVRVISLLVIVGCQVVMAHAMWMFSRHQVVAFSAGSLALVMWVSAGILAFSTLLLIIKLSITG